MKAGLSIEALATEVARIDDTKRDLVVDTRNLTLSSSPGSSSLYVGEDIATADEFDVNDYAHGQIASHLKIPKVYYDRLRSKHPGILDANVNGLLRAEPSRQMIRTVDGKARAFLSDRYRRLDNYDLLTHVVPTLTEILGGAPGAHVASAGLTDTKLWLTVILPMEARPVRVGQTVKLGVRISNSEVGAGACAVETIIYTLECLNGMVVGKALRRNHVGRRADAEEDYSIYRDETLALDDAAFFAKVSDSVRACADEARFEQIVHDLRATAETLVEEEPIKAIEELSNKADLTDGEKDAVLRHLIEGGDLSAWGYVSALTRAAQDVDDYDRSMQLEKVGGTIAAEPSKFLPNVRERKVALV
jgi:hypothetical protein